VLPVKNRISFFYVQRGALSVVDGCLVLTDNEDNTQYEVPARATTTIMVGPGASVTTEAIRLAAAYGVLITWVGEHGVRCYSAGRPWGDNPEWLERQVQCYADPKLSLAVAREMFFRRFGVRMERRSIEQLRGMEGARVRELYKLISGQHKVRWRGRRYVPGNPLRETDAPNLALNVANTCLYGLVETAINAAGMSAGLGFIHRGSRLSYVLDIADLYKMSHTVPLAFRIVARKGPDPEPWPELEMDVRRACRDLFRDVRLIEQVVGDATGVIDAVVGA
jgi:CRISPR-associated protein Cas1